VLPRSFLLLGVLATSVSAQTLHLCRDDPTEEGKATMLWAQMRLALASADSADMAGREPLAISRFDRTVDRNGEVKFETAVDGRRYGTRLLRGASPEDLSREGFVVVDSAGHALFRAPDAHVFLSQQFASDHCFETVQGTGFFTGMAGLRFRPVTGRKVSDIAGVFWADADSGALHLVEFSYVTYGTAQKNLHAASGRLMFEQLPSANWIIRDWVLRTPVTTERGQLLGHRDQGGEAMLVSQSMFAIADSIRNARKAPGRIAGVVVDSLVNRAFVGARVWLDTAGPEARSDSRGAFTLGRVTPGVHVVNFAHPTLDSLGVRALQVRLRVESDSTTTIVLAGPTLGTLKGRLCADSSALVTGIIRDAASGAPIDSAQVTFGWIELVFSEVGGRLKRADLMQLQVQSNARGRYAACVPPNPEFTIFARTGAARTGGVDIRADERGLGIANFSIDRLGADPRFGTATIQGIVKYQDDTPLSYATVRLTDPEMSATTDEGGRFRIPFIPGGTRVLDTRALGYAPVRTVVDVRPRDTTHMTVYMRKVHTLDPVMVRAAAGDGSPRTITELEERRRRGSGHRLTQSDLGRFQGARMDAVVRSLPFARVRSTSNGTRVTLRSRTSRECEPTIWLDGRPTLFEAIEMLDVRDALAVEAFAQKSEVPLDYQNASDCGAILVWTRAAVR
jgi:hypothetical protein